MLDHPQSSAMLARMKAKNLGALALTVSLCSITTSQLVAGAADGRIYFASTHGTVSVIEAGDTMKVLAKNQLSESIMATPAIADDKLYVRTANHLWAFSK